MRSSASCWNWLRSGCWPRRRLAARRHPVPVRPSAPSAKCTHWHAAAISLQNCGAFCARAVSRCITLRLCSHTAAVLHTPLLCADDFVKIKVRLGSQLEHYYILSRFLLSRMLTVITLPQHKVRRADTLEGCPCLGDTGSRGGAALSGPHLSGAARPTHLSFLCPSRRYALRWT